MIFIATEVQVAGLDCRGVFDQAIHGFVERLGVVFGPGPV